jgi:hypothetical protein
MIDVRRVAGLQGNGENRNTEIYTVKHKEKLERMTRKMESKVEINSDDQ